MAPSSPIAFWVIVALQVLALLGFAGVRENTLRTGREIVLATVPVDPRDLFRGDYVVLRYDVSSVSSSGGYFGVGSTAYVRLVEDAGVWKAAGVTGEPPEEGGPYLRGRVTQSSWTGREQRLAVEYGIESYFVPEGTGRRIEQAAGKLQVKVAVDGWGSAAIKELLIDE